MKLRTFMMCLGMSILYADKPASIFKTTATPAAAQSNYNKAIDAMLEENYDGMWKWYSVLDEKDRAKLLQELTTNKSPNDIPAQLHTIKTKINNLAAVITLPDLWNEVLFPTPSAKPTKPKPKPDIKGIEASSHPDKVKLFGKDKGEAMLSWKAAMNPNVARTLKVTIEETTRKSIEDEGIPVPSLTGAQLKTVIPWLEFIDAEAGRKPYTDLSAQQQKQLLDTVLKEVGYLDFTDRPTYLIAAHWLNAPILERALIWSYAEYLHRKREVGGGILQHITEDHIPDVLWDDISRAYFLKFDQDIDQILWPKEANKPQRHTYIDYDVLDAYGKFNSKVIQEVIKLFPNFKKNPHQVVDGNVFLGLLAMYQMQDKSESKRLADVQPFLKLKGLDINAGDTSPLFDVAWRHFSLIAERLLEYGANPNLVSQAKFSEGQTPLFAGAFDDRTLRILVKHGASIDDAIESAKKTGSIHNAPRIKALEQWRDAHK